MLFIYRVIINLITLISPLIIILRLLKKKEDPKRFKEKFCLFSKKKKKGKLIWFHGASIGEILSVIPLIEKLEKQKEIKNILITSNTLSSSKIISNLNFKKVIHQFFPIDTNYHTQKFLKYWKPSIAIFIDSEIWPNMIYNIKKNNISLALINARITNKSFKRWKIFSKATKNIFQKFDICFSSNFESKKSLKLLGAKNIKYIGNLKFTQTEKDISNLNKNIKKFFLTKRIWCASSTHKNEEKIFLEVHKKLKTKYKNLLTIIIPRHIDRAAEILKEIKKLKLSVHLHESRKNIANETDIYLVNSFGQTRSFFKICKTVFLGGSIIKHGGQNPLEAAKYGCNILHGPNVWNFDEIYSLLKKHKISNKVNNSKQLFSKVNEMLSKISKSNKSEHKFKTLGNKILNSTLKEMNSYIT
jgi:3-deoxy-D-manno-octulosonic-acid transferase